MEALPGTTTTQAYAPGSKSSILALYDAVDGTHSYKHQVYSDRCEIVSDLPVKFNASAFHFQCGDIVVSDLVGFFK